ncbi:MAG: hypothetical protein FWE40_06835 [Oscillospiraceae bacterium]|nr:hypothetical protein [Oscillospiraceae bacterium]
MKDYAPNEKYRNMFGVQRQGYGMERVDLYLAQLEVAFKKIREDNRNLKRELAGREGGAALLPSDDPAAAQQAQQQEHYIAQLQQQLAAEQEQSRRLHEQLAHAANVPAPAPVDSSGELHRQLQAAHQEIEYLRHQLNQQASDNTGDYEQDMHCIAKTLIDARRQADDTLLGAEQEARRIAAEITSKAQQDAEAALQTARRRLEELNAERDRVFSQLQGISHAVRNVLRDSHEPHELHQARPTQVDYRLREQNLSRQAR